VRRVIRAVQPRTVVVELCPARAARLMAPPSAAASSPHAALSELLAALGAPGSVSAKLLGLTMKGFYAAWRHAGLEPGLEFKVALQEAAALNAAVVHGDRDVRVTLERLAGTFSLGGALRAAARAARGGGAGFPTPPPQLSRVLSADVSVEEAIERLKNRDTVAALTAHLRRVAPDAVRVMLDERDDVLTAALRRCEGPQRIVAVVGLAHVDGIEARWAALEGQEAPQRQTGGGVQN
jgi:pheromone shutdown protein TraB